MTRRKNRGRSCPCGHGRGFKTEALARAVHDEQTLRDADYYQCETGAHHWTPKESNELESV